MLVNAFTGAEKAPKPKELASALGSAKTLWDELVALLHGEVCDSSEWGSSSKKMGWSLRVKKGDRIIVYLSPSQEAFLASFALGDKAMKAARALKLNASTAQALKDARRYAEGHAVRIEVRTNQDVNDVAALAKIKSEN